MVLDLLLIGLGITLEPFPLIAFLLILSSEKGTRKGLAFILGWLACLVVVIGAVVLLTGGKPPAPSTAPSTAVLAIKLALGVVLILYAIRQERRRWAARARPRPGWAGWTSSRRGRAAGLAAFLQPWTLVAAGAATVSQAKLSNVWEWLVLLLFCLLATSSFLYLELSAAFRPVAAGALIQKLRTWLDTHQEQVIIVICLLLGFWLAGKSLYLLVT